MSYESNWGFTDPTDEFGVRIAYNDYGSSAPVTENNDFMIKIGLHSSIRKYHECSRSELQKCFMRFRITSDFEPISSTMVSRYFMTSMPGSFATPTGNGEVTIFKGTSEILDDSSSCPVITLLKNLYGLEGHFVDKVDCDAAELDYDTVIQCFLGAIFHHILLSEEWFAFSIDGQTKGVFAKSSTESTSLVDVVAIQDCTMASQGSAILLRVKTQCLRITKSLLGDYIAADSEDTVKTDVKSMIFLPTGEEVTVSSDDSYRGTVITSNDRTHYLQSKENERRKKSSTPAPQTGSVLLTELDVKNRNRGYSLFLPDDKTKCDDYWRLGYGINLISDVAGIIGGASGDNYHLSEVTMELGDLRIIPIQLLVSSITSITSRTRRLALSTATDFTIVLRLFLHVESVSEPTSMQRIGIDASDSMSQRRNMTDTVTNSASRSHFQSALKLRDGLDPMVSAGRIITKQSTRFVAPMQATLIRDKAETTPKQSHESRKFRQEKPTFIASKEQNTLADTIKPIGMSSLIPHPMNKPVPQSVIVHKTVQISCNEEAKRKNVKTADNSIPKKSKRCRDGEDAVLVESREEFPKNRLITAVNVVGINTTCGHTISSDDESLSLGTPDDIDDDDLFFEE